MTPQQLHNLEIARVQARMHATTSAEVSRVVAKLSTDVADVVDELIESNNEGVNNLWKSMGKGDETEEE